jgi:hypothetical protein
VRFDISFLDAMGITDESERVRPDDHPRDDVAEHLRHAHAPPQKEERERGHEDDRDIDQRGCSCMRGETSR